MDIRRMLGALVSAEDGGELIEYALLAALVALATIKSVEAFGKKDVLKLLTTIGTDFRKSVK
jgi:Flp pilus assembly pilin Flp